MLKYLVIVLANDATSYCHYECDAQSNVHLISLDNLKKAILFGMKENLNIQFVYPHYALPLGYNDVIEAIDHIKIMPYNAALSSKADIVVFNSIGELGKGMWRENQILTLRVFRNEIGDLPSIFKLIDGKCQRINILIKDIDKFSVDEFDKYKSILSHLGSFVRDSMILGGNTQINILTDRMVLQSMNNCNAGTEVVSILPNGHFYPCAGFYYDNPAEDFGDLARGLEIKNKQLYSIDYAPICQHCDAFHCRRCAWLNRKNTLEVNTPSHEQCVVAHLERNESGRLLSEIRKEYDYLPETTIPDIDYLDPFVKHNDW